MKHSPILDDAALAATGADLIGAGGGRTLVIACGALARETLAVLAANGLAHVDVACLPALLHNRPERIPAALQARIRRARAEGYTEIAVGYADCGTCGGIDRVCEEEGVERAPGPHCYAFFDGVAAFDARADEEVGTFYLTDFLARQFDAIIWRGLGLDRHPELRDLYFGNYIRVTYLAQTRDPQLELAARAAADRLGLAFDMRFTGYGDYGTFLQRSVGAPGVADPGLKPDRARSPTRAP